MTIWILFLAVVLGLIAGVVRRGDFRNILNTRVYHPEFLASSIVCALVVSATDVDSDGVIAFAALLGAFAFTLMNLHLVGMIVVSIGLALNLFVFILNFETPVRPNALVEAEIVTAAELERGVSISGHVELADNDTVLGILGDTFPIRLGEKVVSIGDLIFLVGLANVTGNLMLGNQRRRYSYGQFWEADESAVTGPEGEAEIPIELDLEAPEPASVYSESAGAYSDTVTAYPQSYPEPYPESYPEPYPQSYPESTTVHPDTETDHPASETDYPESTTVHPDTETDHPASETDYPESTTVYPESYDEYSESPTVYPQSAPQTSQPEDSEDADDPWSEPPWNPTS